jgi:calcineurin-like phosphoesterase family protein
LVKIHPIKKERDETMIYYFADTHFGHSNIIKMCKRPFQDIEEMDRKIIQNWNSRITNNDDIYFIGDFSYKGGSPQRYLSQLKGKKHLVLGNHDGKIANNPDNQKYFVEIDKRIVLKDNDKMIVLEHFPLVEWEGYFRGSIHIYGHIHNNTTNQTYQIVKNLKNAYNAGADILDFYPRTLQEVVEYNELFWDLNP